MVQIMGHVFKRQFYLFIHFNTFVLLLVFKSESCFYPAKHFVLTIYAKSFINIDFDLIFLSRYRKLELIE